MKKVSCILFLFLTSLTYLQAQVTFEKAYDFWDNSDITGIYPLADGYLLCGKAIQFHGLYNDNFIFIIRTDNYGDTIYTRKYLTSDVGIWNHPLLVDETNEGFYIAYSDFSYSYLQKFDLEGDTLWTKVISEEHIVDFIQTADGNFTFLCFTNVGFKILKSDKEGNELWTNYVSTIDTIHALPDKLTSIIEIPNGDFQVSVNYSDNFGEHYISQYLFLLDNTGEYLGKREVVSGMPWPEIYELYNCEDDVIAIGVNDRTIFYISRLNQSGDTLWTRHYLEGINQGWFSSITRGSDGNFVMAGELMEQDNSYVALFAFTPQGDYLWHKLYVSGYDAESKYVTVCKDGGYAAGGHVGSWPSEKAYFIKTDANGHISGPGIFENKTNGNLKLYPNPASEFVILEIQPEFESVEILDISGKQVFKLNFTDHNQDIISVDLRSIKSGIYILKIFATNSVFSEKLMIIGFPN